MMKPVPPVRGGAMVVKPASEMDSGMTPRDGDWAVESCVRAGRTMIVSFKAPWVRLQGRLALKSAEPELLPTLPWIGGYCFASSACSPPHHTVQPCRTSLAPPSDVEIARTWTEARQKRRVAPIRETENPTISNAVG